MKERYTSHELSKKLAEAGLVTTGYHVWCLRFGRPSVEEWCHQEDSGRSLCTGARHVRALDLTDVVNEIRRLAPTCDFSVHTCDIGFACQVWTGYLRDLPTFEDADPESLVEAAGLVLLAMLCVAKAESVAAMTDDEVLAEARVEGIDTKAEADRLRAMLKESTKR